MPAKTRTRLNIDSGDYKIPKEKHFTVIYRGEYFSAIPRKRKSGTALCIAKNFIDNGKQRTTERSAGFYGEVTLDSLVAALDVLIDNLPLAERPLNPKPHIPQPKQDLRQMVNQLQNRVADLESQLKIVLTKIGSI